MWYTNIVLYVMTRRAQDLIKKKTIKNMYPNMHLKSFKYALSILFYYAAKYAIIRVANKLFRFLIVF